MSWQADIRLLRGPYYSILCLESLFDNFTPILSKSNIINSPNTSHTFIIGHMCSSVSETFGHLQAIIYMMLA